MSLDLDAIKYRWDDALTYRPSDKWHAYQLEEAPGRSSMIGIGIEGDDQGHLVEVVPWMPELADAIVHSRGDIWALVAEVEALRAELAEHRPLSEGLPVGTLVRVRPDGSEAQHERNLGYPAGTLYRVKFVHAQPRPTGRKVLLAAVDDRYHLDEADWSMSGVSVSDLEIVADDEAGQ